MATRARRKWAPDPRGYYARQIGWELSKSGKLQQHKFLLGTDRKDAESRERKLRELWDAFEKSCQEPRPLWPPALLAVAQRIAKGIPDIPVPRAPHELQHQYAARIQRMQAKYPVICFIPADQHAYEVGQAALELFESIPDQATQGLRIQSPTEDQVRAHEELRRTAQAAGISLDPGLGLVPPAPAPLVTELSRLGIVKPDDPAAVLPKTAKPGPRSSPAVTSGGHPTPAIRSKTPAATLYQAFKRYQGYLQNEFYRHETGHISPWGQIQVRQIKNLQRHHSDRLLSQLDATAVAELIGYP